MYQLEPNISHACTSTSDPLFKACRDFFKKAKRSVHYKKNETVISLFKLGISPNLVEVRQDSM